MYTVIEPYDPNNANSKKNLSVKKSEEMIKN